ncbi:hypothetical protein COCON_G00058170 [Conger conger]|uniref:PDZ domain-containing protein n=1 Tax=Conger conger TaxID=82655 RepID=A0A9Q1I362_CONCO|nr:hypothetical protein COCON_G00058170 [Conger conger]
MVKPWPKPVSGGWVTGHLQCLMVKLGCPPGGLGLRPEGVGAHGVFVRQVQPGSIADRDGRLKENDQILVINGTPLDQSVTQSQALAQLQQAEDRVELVVARAGPAPQLSAPPGPYHTEQWGRVEEIELVNDGSGLGFGIVGGRATGVVVRTLVPGSVADRDGRLRTGDHILCIGDTPTQGLASDQVVRVLQGCGSRVRMLVARDPLGEPQPAPAPPPAPASGPVSVLPHLAPVSALTPRRPPATGPIASLPSLPPVPPRRAGTTPNLEGYEIHEVSLKKKEGQSLGISIVGYNALSSENTVGVFVKYVVPGSAAEQCGNIKVHDRIIALDGVSLHGFTNQEVLQVMKQTGQTVNLTVVRKMAAKSKPTAMERSLDKVERESSRVSLKRSAEVTVRSAVELVDSGPGGARPQLAGDPDQASLTEWELRTKWEQALGPDYSVLVVGLDPVIEDDAELQKYSKLLPIHTMRLGVELDSFDGHHYISTVAPEGPVAKHGLLRPEDELLEVNGVQLYGKSRREAVAFLREEGSEFLPREQEEQEDWHLQEQTRSNPPVLAERGSPWPGEVESSLVEVLLERATERQESPQLVEERPREEEEEEEGEEEGELALWSPEVKVLELEKGEQGLGFSILDYQDPLDIARSVIVIRSLVPGGVAEAHGGVLPGDQLVFVNDTHLDTCHLPQAVEVLKAAPPGTVYLGIRKPLVTDESRGSGPVEVEAPREEAEVTEDTESLRETSPPVPESFADDPPSPREPSDEPEWILDGSFSLPRYASPSTAPRTPPGEREMAVDDEEVEEEEEEEEEEQAKDSTSEEEEEEEGDDDDDDDEEGPSLYPERDTPVWDELEEAAPVAPPPGLAHLPQDLETIRPPLEHRALLDLSTEMWRETGESDVDSDSRNGGSELTLTDTDTESIQSAAKEERKRRSQGAYRPAQRGGYRDLPEREEGEGEETPVFSHWGPPRRVEVWQDPEESLGISIVGGRAVIKRLKNGEELRGIFIKQVLPESPAGRTQALRTGDKILQVSGVDLTNASHEEAVEAIKGATSPVVFIVQSLSATPRPVSIMAPSLGKHKARRQGAQRGPAGGAPPPMRLPVQTARRGGGGEAASVRVHRVSAGSSVLISVAGGRRGLTQQMVRLPATDRSAILSARPQTLRPAGPAPHSA